VTDCTESSDGGVLIVNSRSFRIGAGEVDAALLAHPAIRSVALIGVPDTDLGQVVTPFVVADGVSDHKLQSFVANELSVHKRPRRVVLLPVLPTNAMGKVQKSLLPR
jgi:fatty acid CoA ligase FadD36